MLTLDFPGSRTLIDAIDAAVVKPTTHELTDSLRNSLCKLIRDKAVTLPDCVFEANAEHYARLGLTVTADDEPDFPGPLAGLLATLRRCPQPVLAVVPCDALGWPEDLIARLHAVLDERRAPAAHMAWREDGGWYTEPLPCLVRASAAEDLAAYLRGGGRSVRGWLARVGAASLEMTAPPGVVNINTLDDLQALERRAAAPAA